MMSLNKRGKTWWISFTAPNGERIRRSSSTTVKREAEELEIELKSQYWKQYELGIITGKTWDEAADEWLESKKDIQSYDKYQSQLKWLEPYLTGKLLTDINKKAIKTTIKEKKKLTSNSTANRFLSVINGVLNMAVDDLEWLRKAPKVKKYKEPKHRTRWLKREDVKKLLTELPAHQKSVVQLALATGLRQGNILQLEWNEVDLEQKVIRIPAEKTKAKKPISVPLNNDALMVLNSERDKHPEFVFTYQGSPLKSANTRAWKKALKRCGIDNLRWHDLRHTWASWQVQAGTPLNILQEMGAWGTVEMVQKYAHLNVDHLAPYANNTLVGGK